MKIIKIYLSDFLNLIFPKENNKEWKWIEISLILLMLAGMAYIVVVIGK